MSDLRALRQQLRARRQSLDEHERYHRSDAAVRQLINHRIFRSAQHIACYLPNDGELDLTSLIEQCWVVGKSVYLPVLSSIHRNHLHFLPYSPDVELVPNQFGIPEPVIRSRRMIALQRLDLVLMPLVGFDASGNRLGMGGGFYDRSFAFLQRHQVWHKPTLLGVAYDFQQVDRLEARPWDVPLKGVVTETGVQVFRR